MSYKIFSRKKIKKYYKQKVSITTFVDKLNWLSKLQDYDYESRTQRIEYEPGSSEGERKRIFMFIDGEYICLLKDMFETEVIKYLKEQGYTVNKNEDKKYWVALLENAT